MSSFIYIQKWIRDVSILHSSDIIVCVCLQVEEVKKHNHCLAFSSAGPQSQTYYVSFDNFTEHLRWQRHAAKVLCGQKSSRKKRRSIYSLGTTFGSAALYVTTRSTALHPPQCRCRMNPVKLKLHIFHCCAVCTL